MTNKGSFILLAILFISFVGKGNKPLQDSTEFPFHKMPAVYPGTKALTIQGDLSVRMLDGAHKFIEQKIKDAAAERNQFWKRNTTSASLYNTSVNENRKKLGEIIGLNNDGDAGGFRILRDKNAEPVTMIKYAGVNEQELLAETRKYRVFRVKWNVRSKINGEGLLLQPKTQIVGSIITLPDADQEPEQLVGLLPGISPASQYARHLAENGYEVLVPAIISRRLLFEGEDKQQTYREWLYRQSFHMGHHIIGYEVQKIMAAIDWFRSRDEKRKIGLAGYGEGGMLAFYAAALDTRVDAVMVSGYFSPREKVWDEPIYRNIFTLLKYFGDAEIASLIAPRALVVEYSRAPEIVDELKRNNSNMKVEGLPYTGYKGKIETPSFNEVKAEFNRIGSLTGKLSFTRELVSDGNSPVSVGSREALEKLTKAMGSTGTFTMSSEMPVTTIQLADAEKRQWRLLTEIENAVQELVRDSDQHRKKFFLNKVMPELAERRWSTRPYHQYYSAEKFTSGAKTFKKYFRDEIIGVFTDSLLPFNAQTRKIYDTERYTGYEVVMDVYSDLFATGILLIPKDLKKNEKRPVVVCQHGRNDIPHKVVEGNFTAYNDAAAKLADEGFIVYVPQNPYRGEDRYRWLARKANTIGSTLFSFIVAQHDQSTRWLATLPFVDKNRIAFYGLSYGGQTAMRVPAALDAYCLSIAAGDFGDWTRKVTDTRWEGSFMNTLEWEMPYFKMGNTFSYAEMSYLIFPRPFMVERGHHDLVQPTEWVSYEFGKVRYLYDNLGMGDKTEIEFFNGGHSMKGDGTFRFLHKHLNWP